MLEKNSSHLALGRSVAAVGCQSLLKGTLFPGLILLRFECESELEIGSRLVWLEVNRNVILCDSSINIIQFAKCICEQIMRLVHLGIERNRMLQIFLSFRIVGGIGPVLKGLSQRPYLAGALPNTPENLVRWIMHPQKYRPRSAMPEMGLTEQDAHKIADFLEANR